MENVLNNDVRQDNTLVGTVSIDSFFKRKSNITIPDYQRPYVWDKEKINQLFSDLKSHFFADNIFQGNTDSYYLGTVLLHKKDDEYQIIDGQQRITTLVLMLKTFGDNGYSQDIFNLNYKSNISHINIKKNYDYLVSCEGLIKRFFDDILKKLVFTVIITPSEDEAFTFFDSQNNRGVPLSAIDFLKSYHLRELKYSEDLQAVFARKWDSNNKGKFLEYLFDHYLWRNRNWKGKWLEYESKTAILNTFQKNSKKSKVKKVKLYPNAFNTLASNLVFDEEKGVNLQTNALWLNTKEKDYPFTLRQPIQKGVGFFLYAEKYTALYNHLFLEKADGEFIKFYDTVYININNYLKGFFKLCSISFYDQFKGEKLFDFALYLDYFLGSIRLGQKAIVAQTIIKILRDQSQNLLDVIDMSYEPQEVFDFLISITDKNLYQISSNEKFSGVRGNYYNSVKWYYKKETETMLNKIDWINDRLIRK